MNVKRNISGWLRKLLNVGGTVFLVIGLVAGPAVSDAQTINGAGASFPYPLYSQWAYKYNSLTGVRINYQSIGSGGGIAQIRAKTVDFGASDAPLTSEELDKAGLIQFPMVIGGVTPVVSIRGIEPEELRLTPNLLAGIFLGTIGRWNDPAIQKVNPGVSLPNLAITVVHRADGSGTTWIFTNYLEKVSPQWREKVGSGNAVQWPTGIGGKGNEGVANNVQRINGSIGYVEYAYALQNKLTYALMQNGEGTFVEPTIETFQSAAANADWENAPGFYMVLTDQQGEISWPITGATFILVHKEQSDSAKAQAILAFFDWCYRHGADVAEDLHYVPMPANAIEIVEQHWRTAVTAGGAVIWK